MQPLCTRSSESLIDQLWNGLKRGRPITVTTAEDDVANPFERIGHQFAEPSAKRLRVVGWLSVVGGGHDHHTPFAWQTFRVFIHRRQRDRITTPRGVR